MSKNVDNIAKLWQDLEQSYGPKAASISRREFLALIIGWNGTTHKLDALKSTLVKDYVGNEEKVDLLVKMFDSISAYLSDSDLPEIDNLDNFVHSIVMNNVRQGSIVAGTIPEDFFTKLNPFLKEETSIVMDLDKHLESTGFVSDVFMLQDGKTKSYMINMQSDDVVIFSGPLSMNLFIQRMGNNQSEFLKKVFKAVVQLRRLNQATDHMVFLDSNLFKVRGQRMTVTLPSGNYHFDVLDKLESDEGKFVAAVHKSGYVTTPVYGVL